MTASPLPVGGHLIRVVLGVNLSMSLDPEEAKQLRDDLTAALESITEV
ncbi:hypothetical protein [Curtobacterium sp. MCBD17_040]|nr:hypothetical protein [Curtobacterium sp. MCBD17_040]WIB65288.1 hypothetical protein DEI94_17945 [Curtobacterium sp. MCBD17_040]